MKSSQKILIASEYYDPHWTGIVKTIEIAAKQLVERGHKVTVLTTQFDASLPLSETKNDITIIRSPHQFRLSRTHYSFSIILKFASMVRNFNTIIINSPNSNVLFFSLLAKIFRKKLIIYHQGDLTLPRLTGNYFLNRLLEVVFDVMTIPSFLLADIASTYTKDYAKNSRVMKYALYKFHPFVPTFILPSAKPQTTFTKKIDSLKKSHVLVGFAGRFVEEKAYEVFLEAMSLVTKEIPNVHFIFAGKKNIDYEPYFEFVKPLVEKNADRLTFLGLLDGGDYRYFYENIEAFVLSSRSDCFPTTQIEAARSGVPIVVTDIPGARMLVKETGFGEIVDMEDEEALAKGIIKVLKNKATYAKNSSKVPAFFKKYGEFPL